MNDIGLREEFLRRIYLRQVPNLFRLIQYTDAFLHQLEEAGVLNREERGRVVNSHRLPGINQLRRVLTVYHILIEKEGFLEFLLFLKDNRGRSKDYDEVFKYFETEVSNTEQIRSLLDLLV